jgi:hypothetical protein
MTPPPPSAGRPTGPLPPCYLVMATTTLSGVAAHPRDHPHKPPSAEGEPPLVQLDHLVVGPLPCSITGAGWASDGGPDIDDYLLLERSMLCSIDAARHSISALPDSHDAIFVHCLAPECFLVVFPTQQIRDATSTTSQTPPSPAVWRKPMPALSR